MSIGFYDEDLFRYAPQLFNLEAMKLSSYFKSKRQVVSLSPFFKPELYTQFYYIKDFNDNNYKSTLAYNNIKNYGLAFSNNKHVILPKEIEERQPDTYLYLNSKNLFGEVHKDLYNSFMNSHHLRLSLDGEHLWKNFDKQINFNIGNSRYIIHDYDIGKIKELNDAIEWITKKSKKNIMTASYSLKFPLKIYDYDTLVKWIERRTGSEFLLQINFLLTDEQVVDLIERIEKIVFYSKMRYNITYGCKDEDDFYINRLPKIYNQILYFCMQRKKISLEYDDNFFVHQESFILIDLLRTFINYRVLSLKEYEYNNTCTFYYYCKTLKYMDDIHLKLRSTEEARKMFQFVYEKNYEVFRRFYESIEVELRGGVLVDK